MVARFVISLILFLVLMLLCPPLFSDGGMFDMTAIDELGKVIHGIYFDNVFFSMLYLGFTAIGISIPYIFKDYLTGQWVKLFHVSTMAGGWYFVVTIFEILNFREPLIVYNTPELRSTFQYFLYWFSLGIMLIIINDKWTKLKTLEQ